MLKVIEAPEEVITVQDAADFMRAEFSVAEEAIVTSLITSARQWCEEYLRRAIGVQTLQLRVSAFPANNGPILLRPPLIDVDSVIYTDPDGVEQTLSVDDYVISDAEPGMIIPVGEWPATKSTGDAVKVEFMTGYYAGGSPKLSEVVPATLKTAILMMVADMYANREAQVEKQLMANPTVERLISTYRLEMGF